MIYSHNIDINILDITCTKRIYIVIQNSQLHQNYNNIDQTFMDISATSSQVSIMVNLKILFFKKIYK